MQPPASRVTAVVAGAAVAAASAALAIKLLRRRAADARGDAAVGLVGLGVMGAQLLLNLGEKLDAQVSGLDISAENVRAAAALAAAAGLTNVRTHNDYASFVRSLRAPRVVLMLVPAGAAVDAVCEEVAPHLSAGDVIVDLGNSRFDHTELRQRGLAGRGVHFIGCGTSGGKSGARLGPCLMAGGDTRGWAALRPILEPIAARVPPSDADDGLCVAYVGRGGSGHYVKMVHNGIEYADMQARAYSAHV